MADPGQRCKILFASRWIVWVNGPFQMGEWLDWKIAMLELITTWRTMNAMWEMEGITMDDSWLRCKLDTTIPNKKCMPWLGYVMKL